MEPLRDSLNSELVESGFDPANWLLFCEEWLSRMPRGLRIVTFRRGGFAAGASPVRAFGEGKFGM